MGSDNGKSSRPSGSTRRKNTKHSERPPPPPDDARSVGSQSTEAAVSMSSRSSVKSSVKHGRDNVSVASSQSSAPIVTAKASYTDMAGKRDKRRHGRKPEKSSGCGRRSFLGLTVMIVWVLFYLARSFNVDSVASFRDSVASLRGGASMNSNEQQVENEGGEADGADEKADTAKEKEDPDADLASLASGAGNNLWEGLLDATTDSDGNSTSSSSTNETSDALSTSNTASSTNKATDGTSASETSLSNNEATQDTSASGIASSTSDAAMSTMESSNAEANEAALSEASALLSGGNSASDLTARSQSLDDSQTTDNAQQLDSQLLPDTQMAEMNAGVQETIQPDGSDRTTSSDLIDGQSTQESTNPQQLTSQGKQALAGQLQETLDVQQQPLVSQIQGYASNGPNGQLSQDSTAHYEANDVQQQLDGVTAENPEGQQMGGDQMATGMQEGTGLETGQVLQSGSLDSETQDINQLAANDAGSQMALQSSDVKQGMLRGSKELQPDGMQQQHEGMRSNDISSQNGGNGMIGQSNNVGDGSMEQQQLPQEQNDGMLSNDNMSSQNGVNGMIGQSNNVGDGSMEQQQLPQEQNDGMLSNDNMSSQNGGNGMIGQSNNGGDGSIAQQDSMAQQQLPQEQNDGMLSNDNMSSQNGGNGMIGQSNNGGDGSMEQQQLPQEQSDGMLSNDNMSSQNGGNEMIGESNNVGDGSMEQQQQNDGMLSSDNTSSQNGDNGMIGQSNNVGDGSMEQQQLQQQQPPKEGMVSNDQQFMVVDNKMLSHGGNSASSGSAGSSVQSSQGSRMMANSNLGDGSISEQQSDGNQMEPNVSQQRVDNRQILTNQVSQGRRRLQEVEQPQSPYENMNPTALAEYVTNHAQYRNLVNFDEDLPFDQSSQVPYLFHIHKSGGSSMKHMITCMGLTQTRRGSAENCNDQANYIHVCPLVWGTAVNADASSPLGIERIKRLGLLDLNVPKLVVTTSRFYEALNILTPQHRGRLFVILRDPVERAISKYYYTKFATWERNYNPAIANMTLMEYAQSKHCYDNWVTRRLIHKMNPDAVLTAGDLRLAKEILKQKALILLTDNLAQSSHRMAQYFGWEMDGNERWCVDKYARTEPVNQNPHPIPHKDSPEWASIRDKNQLDVELYRYAMSIYHDQQGPFLSQKFGPLQLSAAVDPEMNQNATPDEE